MEVEPQIFLEWLVGDELTADVVFADCPDFNFLAESGTLIIVQDEVDERLLTDLDIVDSCNSKSKPILGYVVNNCISTAGTLRYDSVNTFELRWFSIVLSGFELR